MGVAGRLREVERALDAIDAVLADESSLALRAPGVSKWSVAQQLEHLSEADLLCLGAAALIVAGEDERIVPTGSPTLTGRVILTLGRIPRGKGRAPEATVPQPEPPLDVVRERLDRGRAVFESLARDADGLRAARGRVPHPMLGLFSATQWLRFTAVHIRHHLAIVADIRKRAG